MAVDQQPVESIKAVPVRHPGRWVAGGVVLVLAAMAVHSLFFSSVERGGQRQSRFQLGVVWHYLFATIILRGLLLTVELTAAAMAIGIVLGIVMAVLRLSPNPLLSGFSSLYIWFFRGTPVLVQLLFWYNITYLFPRLSFGVPFGPGLFDFNANSFVTPVAAAIIGLGLNEGAYMAEIVRAGILSVDEGQTEAAMALGMTRLSTMRRIVLPQAMRVIVPPTGNEVISMLKTTSLASTITVAELTYAAIAIYSRTFETVPLLTAASIWYIVVTTLLTIGQYYVERYFARGAARQLPPTPWQRVRARLAGTRLEPAMAVENRLVGGFGQEHR